MTTRGTARAGLVVALFVMVQQTLMLDLRVGGVHPDIMILLPIVAGLVGGPSRGASMGFVAGLVADLFLPTPFGLSALVATLIGFAVGVATLALDRTAAVAAGGGRTRRKRRLRDRLRPAGLGPGPAPDAPRRPASGSSWWCR